MTNEINKIYIVTDGEYSDYHIIGAFTDETQAERVAKEYNARVEEFVANEIGKDGRYQYTIHMNDEETRAYISSSTYTDINKVTSYKQRNNPPQLDYTVTVMAEDKEHAVKIASDLIRAFKSGQHE